LEHFDQSSQLLPILFFSVGLGPFGVGTGYCFIQHHSLDSLLTSSQQNIAIIMGIAMVPTTVFCYSYLFLQKPISKNGACTALSGVGLLGQKWPFAAANMVCDSIQKSS
jgi:hypothetical protein